MTPDGSRPAKPSSPTGGRGQGAARPRPADGPPRRRPQRGRRRSGSFDARSRALGAWLDQRLAGVRRFLRVDTFTRSAAAGVAVSVVVLVVAASLVQSGRSPDIVVVPTTDLIQAPGSGGPGAAPSGNYLAFCTTMSGVVGRLTAAAPAKGGVPAKAIVETLQSIDLGPISEINVPEPLDASLLVLTTQMSDVIRTLQALPPDQVPDFATVSPEFVQALTTVVAVYLQECR